MRGQRSCSCRTGWRAANRARALREGEQQLYQLLGSTIVGQRVGTRHGLDLRRKRLKRCQRRERVLLTTDHQQRHACQVYLTKPHHRGARFLAQTQCHEPMTGRIIAQGRLLLGVRGQLLRGPTSATLRGGADLLE